MVTQCNAKTRPTSCSCRCRKMFIIIQLLNRLLYIISIPTHFNGVGFYIITKMTWVHVFIAVLLFILSWYKNIFNRLICAVGHPLTWPAYGEAVGYERPKFGYRPTITTPFFLFLFCYGQVYSEISRYYCPSDYISILQSWRCRLNWNNIRILLTERLEYFGQPKNGK